MSKVNPALMPLERGLELLLALESSQINEVGGVVR